MTFLKQVTLKNRMQRCKASLAYDILCNKNKYEKFGNEYRIKNKDFFIMCYRWLLFIKRIFKI